MLKCDRKSEAIVELKLKSFENAHGHELVDPSSGFVLHPVSWTSLHVYILLTKLID